MSWWDEDFVDFLSALFTPASESSMARGKAIGGTIGKPIKAVQSITAEQEAAGKKLVGSTPTPTPSVTPSATPSPSTPANPLAASGSQQSKDFLNAVITAVMPAWQAAQKQTQGNINGVDPKAPVFMERKTEKVFRPTGLNARDVAETTEKVNKTRTLEEVMRDPFSWEDKKLKDVGLMMFHANLIGQGDIVNRDKIGNAWAILASTSARMYEVGKKVSPMDLLKRQSFGLAGSTGGSLAKTVTSTSTDVTVTNATTARQLAQAALSQRVGRKATESEVTDFVNALRAEEKKNPTVQTSTTTTNAEGTSQTSRSTTKQGLNPNAFADQYSMNYDTAEAEAYQVAGLIMPWFFDALKAPA